MFYQTFWSNPATNHFSLSDVEMGLQQSPGKLIALTQLHAYPVSWPWALTRNYRYFLFGEIFLSQQVSEEIWKKALQAKFIPKRDKVLGVFFPKKRQFWVIFCSTFAVNTCIFSSTYNCVWKYVHTCTHWETGKIWPAQLLQEWIFCHWLCAPAQLLK